MLCLIRTEVRIEVVYKMYLGHEKLVRMSRIQPRPGDPYAEKRNEKASDRFGQPDVTKHTSNHQRTKFSSGKEQIESPLGNTTSS